MFLNYLGEILVKSINVTNRNKNRNKKMAYNKRIYINYVQNCTNRPFVIVLQTKLGVLVQMSVRDMDPACWCTFFDKTLWKIEKQNKII